MQSNIIKSNLLYFLPYTKDIAWEKGNVSKRKLIFQVFFSRLAENMWWFFQKINRDSPQYILWGNIHPWMVCHARIAASELAFVIQGALLVWRQFRHKNDGHNQTVNGDYYGMDP